MTDRNYVAAWLDYDTDKIHVMERDSEGKLFQVKYAPSRYFYIPDENGEFKTIFGNNVSKISFADRFSFENARKQYPLKFESDIQPVARLLMDEYYGRPTPIVNYAFIDIEVDYRTTKYSNSHKVKIRKK